MGIWKSSCALFRNSRSLRVASVAALLLFAVLLSAHFALSYLILSYQSKTALENFGQGITADKTYLLGQGNAIAADESFIEVASSGDPERILPVIKTEREKRNIGLMGFANEHGVILSRTLTSSSTGENAFLTSPQGRALSAGAEYIASIEISSFDPVQLLMTTGRHVYNDGKRIGALFSNRLMDDVYAANFRDSYLPYGSEVFFYTNRYGIYGSSIHDAASRQLIVSYFNVDSDWIQTGKTGTMVRLDDSQYYQVHNIPFIGVEGNSLGGALVLIPYYGYSVLSRIIFSILAIVLFTWMVLRCHPTQRVRNRYYYGTLAACVAVILVIMLVLSRAAFMPYSPMRKIPYILYNSTLRIQPEAGVFDSRFERQASVIVNTGSEHINAVNVSIDYDPDQIEIIRVDTSESICSLFLENKVDRVDGNIRLACGLPSPGFSGSTGLVADILYKPRTSGIVDLKFSPDTMVLANDGLGTNVLRRATNANYRFMENIEGDSVIPGQRSMRQDAPIIFSPTHPNGGRWYSIRDARFSWDILASTTDFIYAFDQSSTTSFVGGSVVRGKSATVSVPGDGVYYFHVAPFTPTGIGPANAYKVMIDSAIPEDVSIKMSTDEARVGELVRLEFDAHDDLSGLQNTMYIDIDESGLFLPVGRQVYVPLAHPGDLPIKLRVYDNAGNFAQIEKVIRVSGKPGQWLMNLTH